VALVRDDAQSLLTKAKGSELHEELARQARIRFDAATGVSDVRSWEMSLPPFLADVVEAGLGHVEVLLEHQLPYTPKRSEPPPPTRRTGRCVRSPRRYRRTRRPCATR
jgi:hypothetical protein